MNIELLFSVLNQNTLIEIIDYANKHLFYGLVKELDRSVFEWLARLDVLEVCTTKVVVNEQHGGEDEALLQIVIEEV